MNQPSFATLFKALAIACGCVTAVSSSEAAAAVQTNDERQLNNENLIGSNWDNGGQSAFNLLNDLIEASQTPRPTNTPTVSPTGSPTDMPTANPSTSPSLVPSASPSESPTAAPSDVPTISNEPSASPSSYPTASPSMAPTSSANPTAAPSVSPTDEPSTSPTMTQEPTVSPSLMPSSSPTISPSASPSASPSGAPSLLNFPSGAPSASPTTSPSQQPTQSNVPSQSPTETKIVSQSVKINQSHTRKSTPLLIVGACCFVVMASTGVYLYKRGSRSGQDGGSRATPTMIEVTTTGKDGNLGGGGGIISPYSIEDGLGGTGGNRFDVNYTDSESRASDEETMDYNYNTKDGMVDVDLETGCVVGNHSVPNSVSIVKHGANENNLNVVVDHEMSGYPSKLRMPKSVYVPKMFQRKDGDGSNNDKQIIAWNQIRDEGHSPCSSGYAPASAASPMLSPFFVKGLSNITGTGKNKGILLTDPCTIDEDGMNANNAIVEPKARPSSKLSAKSKKNKKDKSPMKEIVVTREMPGCGEDAMGDAAGQKSPTNLSKSSDGSSIEWGIDVSKVQPSKSSFEANMNELKNLLVSIKSLGSGEAPEVPTPNAADVQMTYTDDSSEKGQSISDDISPKSDASTFLGGMDIAPIDSASTQDSGAGDEVGALMNSPLHASPNHSGMPAITYGRELLNSHQLSEEGTFNFRNIFNDPKNDLYECHAPSGPLGLVVDTTPLGPRVRSLNPLSPIFGKISPGDVIVGVDEVDTVGMEAGDFWQVVSRKANQQERILTILRI